MSQNQSEPPSAGNGARDFDDEELAAQAKAAADQALELARLAAESARLARQLNEQVAARRGISLPGRDDRAPPPDSPAPSPAGTEPAPHVEAPLEESWFATAPTGTSTRRRRRTSAGDRYQRARSPDVPEEDLPRQVRIKPNANDRQREEGPVTGIVRNWRSVLLSTAFHLLILAALGALTFAINTDAPIDTILASFADEVTPVQEELPVEEPLDEPGEQQREPTPQPPQPTPEEEPPPALEPPPAEPSPIPTPEERMEVVEKPTPPTPGPEPAAEQAVDLAAVGSRSDAGKAMLLEKYGGTAASESAVSRGLDWFVSVQRRDGSWNFDDVGGTSHAGDVSNPMGATSYVLLAFLGAGQTHRDGKHKASVGRALNFLLNFARRVGAGVDLRGTEVEDHHNFYVQGAAAMALCEAFAMTKDRRLRLPAQGAIDFIVAAQDPVGGGWRYVPREAGCTSVTTLQLTALIDAGRTGLNVPPSTLQGVEHFYRSVKCDEGPTGRYCYRTAEPRYTAASTAQAALARMYLGATRDDEDLQAAVALLDDRGPYENRYYCYYATQVMKNWGGDEWDRWNESMRDELVRTQIVQEGPAQGSWTPLQRGDTDTAGGRLFTTALCTMTLEVYYRYLPLYDSFNGTESGFTGQGDKETRGQGMSDPSGAEPAIPNPES